MTVKSPISGQPAVAVSQLQSYGSVPVSEPQQYDVGGSSWGVKAHGVELAEDEGPRFQDVPFAVLFLAQLATMLYFGITLGTWGSTMPPGSDDAVVGEEVEKHLVRVVYYLAVPSTAVAFVLAYVGTAIVIPLCPETAVGGSLALSLVSMGAFCVLLILSYPAWYTWLGAIFMFAITAYYLYRVRGLIPFAAANLMVALKGMSANWGVYLISIVMMVASFFWFVFWLYAANGIFSLEERAASDSEKEEDAQEGAFWGSLFLMLVSLYWTSTVILNTIRVTVAGIMGTWCFNTTDATGCCSLAVLSSLYRSLTYSFGSICFGSLLEALVTALRILAENAKERAQNNDDECSILFCILECLLRLVEDIIEYFNQWAYVFCGIYGYSYLESGRKVMELFRARGWTAIITNDIVGYCLNLTAVLVGILTGLCGLLIETTTSRRGEPSFLFGDVPRPTAWAFGIGFFVGIFIAAVMMNVIKGAVNTVIVCFADKPATLEENHPDLTYQMATAWVSVFPECGVRVPAKQQTAYATVVV